MIAISNMKVSIITVVYNGVKTIEQTIKSVLGQTYKNIEYIIIDGNSTDGTQEVVKKYNDEIALFISEKDSGLYDAMNKGIEHSSGDIIGIINSDDWYAFDAVENVIRVFQNGNIDVVYGMMEIVYNNGFANRTKNGPLEDMIYKMVIPHPTAFVKKKVYEKIGLFNSNYRIAADYDLFLRIYLSGIKIHQIPHVIAYFRHGGLSTNKAVECADETKAISLHYAQGLKNIEVFDKIDEYYKMRVYDAKTREKISKLINCFNKQSKYHMSNLMKEKTKISIFGAGNKGIECVDFLEKIGVEVECFLDNDAEKCQSILFKKKVRKYEANEKEKNFIVIAVMNFQKEITDQLVKDGYQKNRDFYLYYDLVDYIYDCIF